MLFGVTALVWLLAGRWLPGGRWVVVHLFTLGVLTILIAAFTRHFSTRFIGQAAPGSVRRPLVMAVVLDLSVIALLVGRLTHDRVLLAIGTVGLLAAIGENLLVLRVARGRAGASPIAWVIGRYENAHVAFLLSAVLGTLLGMGVVPGAWYLGVRDAHIHLNVLGWAGLTVLATLAVFGPTLLRVRGEPGADERAASGVRLAAGALFATAAWLVLASGLPAEAGASIRMVATVSLLVYGWGVAVVASLTLASARRSPGSPSLLPVAGAVLWLLVGVLVDVVAVAASQRGLFDVVGVVLFVGVLAQLVLGVLLHLVPTLRGSDPVTRDALRQRSGRLAVPRAVLLNLGVVVVAVGLGAEAVSDLSPDVVVRTGWVAIALGIVAHLVGALWPAATPTRAA